ncbi:MAG: hypothetical protein ACREGA_02810 [Candidatus Saccharimonadales bacterium]
MALANGVKDSLSAVLLWQQENAFRITVDSMAEALLPEGISKDELLSERWQKWRSELGRVQSVNNTIKAIGKAKRWLAKAEGQPKVVPADSINVKADEADVKSYRFEVLAGDDPRGFTIGEDTGCCMTINGVSNSCIKAGYKNPDAGFMALYALNGSLAAQSFMYVNPKYPDVLVLDNIEVNEGRDIGKITELYKKAWQQYLEEHPDLAIKNVHIGEGYTYVNISHLPKADAVPPINENIYTDAERQRKLI